MPRPRRYRYDESTKFGHASSATTGVSTRKKPSKKKQRSRPVFRPTGTKVGVGVRHTLFPIADIWRPKAAGFPTLFSTASGVVGLAAGPSVASRLADY